MTISKLIHKHISFDIKSRKTNVHGLIINSSDAWTLAFNNVVDYICDGFLLIHNPSIKKHYYDKENKWTEKIILIKTKQSKTPKIILDDSTSVFSSLQSLKKVISISNKKGDITWIGKIIDVLDDSIIIRTLTTKAKWAEKKSVLFKEMSIIEFDTDYINSLLLLADN
ncbi:hypothetical protein CNR22_09085 [Sphingobacteriaceae bacterium]|nr:hypothetical protein CNR22_09085 [Sphingobacteriaceae bacterium]